MNTRCVIITMFAAFVLLTWSICLAAPSLSLGPDGYGKMILQNGMTVVVNQDKSTALSSARIVIGGGVLTETAETNGIGNLMIKLALKGNSIMTAAQVSEQLDFLGVNISADCFKDYTAVSFSCLSENFDKALAIVTQSLRTPTFTDEELTKLKAEVEGQIKSANDNQTQVSGDLFWKAAYDSKEYGLRTIGTAESVAGITSAMIKSYFDQYAGGRNMVVAISTDLSAETIEKVLQDRFEPFKSDAAEIPAPVLKLQTEKTGFASFNRNQSFIYMGYMLGKQDQGSLARINILHQLMGSGVGVRLWYLRQTEKLAYAVYTQWLVTKYSAQFRAAIGTDTSKVKQALASLDREWNRLVKEGITETELATAKVNMKNSLIFQIDNKLGRAGAMANYEYLGYGYKFILDQIALADSITLADVNDFIRANLTEDRRYLSVVGKM